MNCDSCGKQFNELRITSDGWLCEHCWKKRRRKRHAN